MQAAIKRSPNNRKKKTSVANKQRGFTLVEMMVGLSILGAMTVAAVPMYEKYKEQELIQATQDDVELIQQAVYAYHMENRSFPPNLQVLKDNEYYFGRMETPYGQPYQLSVNAQGTAARVVYNTPTNRTAQILSKSMPQSGLVDDDTVEVAIGRPSREAVLSTFVHRTEQAGCADCNTMETDLDMGGNNIANIQKLAAEEVETTQLTADNTQTNNLTVNDRISIGGAQMTATASGMDIQASSTNFSGNINLQGDFTSAGGDMTGFNQVEVNSLEAQDVNAQNTTTNALTATSADIDQATITDLSGETFTYDDGVFTSFQTDDLTAATGAIDNLSGNTLDYGTGTINNLESTSFQSATGQIEQLTGNTMNYGFGSFNNMTVNGTTDTQSLNSNLINTQTANAVNVDADAVVANTGRFVSYSANNLSFSGNLSVNGELSAQDVDVSNELETNNLDSNNSNLGSANAQNMTVTGNTNVGNLDVTGDADIDSLLFGTAQGGSLSVNSVSADSGVFSTFEATSVSANDVSSSLSTINNNYSLIQTYKSQWESCKASGGCQ